jgi:hypothetical protein
MTGAYLVEGEKNETANSLGTVKLGEKALELMGVRQVRKAPVHGSCPLADSRFR